MRGIDFKTAGGYNVKEALLLLPALLFILGASVLFALSAEQISIPVSASLRRGFPVLIIDPGHGGLDSGAVAFNGVRESDVNLSIALKMEQLSNVDGVNVDSMNASTYDDAKKSDSINITIEALGYAAPNSTSGQIVISQNPSYKVIVSSVASYKNGELVVDTDKMKVDSVLKLF